MTTIHEANATAKQGDQAVTPASPTEPGIGRREVLTTTAAVAGLVATATLVSACDLGSESHDPASAGTVLAPVSAVPVGGALIVNTGNTAYVVAQQTAGEIVCHSAVCPHQGCLCTQIQSGEAVCPCHGSRFDAFSGAVLRGPASTGLTSAPSHVTGGQVVLG